MSIIRFTPHLALALIAAAAIAGSAATAHAVPLGGSDEYNSAGFVVRHAWVKFASVATEPLRDHLSLAEEDRLLARFFELNRLIRDGEQTAGDPETSPADATEARRRSAALREERAGIENRVERILEGRVTNAIKRAGLTRYAGTDIVWPPVSIEFEEPPSVLVKSPREIIRRDSERLLQGDLPIARVQELEAQAERDGHTSALVVRIGAIAMYPAIVPPSTDERSALETIAHEWLHHYLYFTPLGRHYYDGDKLTTLNETVANMGGRELACVMISCADDVKAGAAPLPQDAFDFVAEMRDLRRKVEALLAGGRIEEAERLMETTRQSLGEHGYYIRRLNQAYFAFHGSYADTAGSIDPIGPKLKDLREQSPSFEAFIETAREFRGESDLDAALR